MTIIQCMIMAYVLTIEQVQILQTVDSRATCDDDDDDDDDDVLTMKSSWGNPITTCILSLAPFTQQQICSVS